MIVDPRNTNTVSPVGGVLLCIYLMIRLMLERNLVNSPHAIYMSWKVETFIRFAQQRFQVLYTDIILYLVIEKLVLYVLILIKANMLYIILPIFLKGHVPGYVIECSSK